MGKRLVIAAVMVTLIVLLGYGLQRAFFDGDDPATPDRASDLAGTSRDEAGDAGSATASTLPDGSAPSPNDAPPRVAVLSVRGTVERRENQAWVPLRADDSLDEDDIIRTGDDGAAVLAVGDAEVELDSETKLSVAAVAAVSRVRLDRGRVEAQVPDDGTTTLGVDIADTGSSAETRGGVMAVLADDKGNATVAVKRGTAQVRSDSGSVDLAEGQVSRLRPGHAPTAPAELPTSLFLKVQQKNQVQSASRHTVRGQATPGAIVGINGVLVEVGDTGEFVSVVKLREGQNRIRVTARDVLGRRQDATPSVTRDSQGPDVEGRVRWEQ